MLSCVHKTQYQQISKIIKFDRNEHPQGFPF
jgi:hypothetical protein